MNNVAYSFIVSCVAGLSTLFGAVFIFFKFKDSDGIILKALAFASGVMMAICVTDLIPSSFNGFMNVYEVFVAFLLVAIFVVVGIILSMLINKYLPSNNNDNLDNKTLYKVGLISMIAIILHNIPEDCICYVSR